MENSILKSVKGSLDIYMDDPTFDNTILMHINSVCMELNQIGIGPLNQPFYVVDETATWSQLTEGATNIHAVQSYMSLAVKLLFDPPKNGFGIQNIEKQLAQMAERLKMNTTDYGEEP